MKIEIEDLYKEFYDKEKDNYPDLDFKSMRDLIKTPWIFLKRSMEDGFLCSVRFKYFGVFNVYKGRVKFMRKRTEENFKKGYITEEKYKEYTKILDRYLNKDENEK